MQDTQARLERALREQYTIEREIGRGGMAIGYLAHDCKHGRPAAIKGLRPELASVMGPERFTREIAITAQREHPNILTSSTRERRKGSPTS